MNKESLKIGIALSGGGVRATAFHLGVLARLAQDGLLENVTFISTVSGGTLAAGLIYSLNGNKWPTNAVYLNEILPKARALLTAKDIQIDAICRLLRKPWYLLQGRAKLISESMMKCWGINGIISELPSVPRWVINATTFESGKNWRFMPQRMGDYVVNYAATPTISVSDAMASSAAYPGLIGPLVLKTSGHNWFRFDSGKQVPLADPILKKLHLWDGGVYDNLGVEALFKPSQKYRDEFNFLIVSDASGTLKIERATFLFKRAYRLVEIAMDQIRSLRSRTLVAHFNSSPNSGVYLRIGASTKYIMEQVDVTKDKIELMTMDTLSSDDTELAASIKTTLRKLKATDIELLVRHGWEVCDTTLHSRCLDLFYHMNYPSH